MATRPTEIKATEIKATATRPTATRIVATRSRSGAHCRPPLASPPFPTAEWQGFPLIGVPPSDTRLSLDEGHLRRPVRRRHQGQRRQALRLGQLARRTGRNCRASNTAELLLGRAQPLGAGPSRPSLRAPGQHGADRPHRLGLPHHGRLWHRLPLLHGRRLVQRPVAGAQSPLRLGPHGSLHEHLLPRHWPAA